MFGQINCFILIFEMLPGEDVGYTLSAASTFKEKIKIEFFKINV